MDADVTSSARNNGRKKCNLLEKVDLACASASALSRGCIQRLTRHASATAIVLPLCNFPPCSEVVLERALLCLVQSGTTQGDKE